MESLNREDNVGIVKISDEVVSVISGIAAQEIEGVSDYPVGASNNLSSILKGKKSLGKSTKVTLLEDKATIDINLSVEYGVKIMEVVSQVQDNVKRTVEAMTGLVVEAVNVYVQNIYMPKKEESESN
ncbi:Asp23/Gls24 family envelope stress response protein [Clostridium taeniosporum]|uniref:Asp23/Gls24 family envelope stress response protein n=1 Tax=Clostridium taeniosporum TaxID=394958 RepID=A0A1D7XL55_9CLOT|nr:Asp23/Gls24 family envelope stress response protein [Clostridium taeniosporum]AOR23910.1 Asp23/Gls24 family envelope stress response protein [Clostridium taeniosporum]